MVAGAGRLGAYGSQALMPRSDEHEMLGLGQHEVEFTLGGGVAQFLQKQAADHEGLAVESFAEIVGQWRPLLLGGFLVAESQDADTQRFGTSDRHCLKEGDSAQTEHQQARCAAVDQRFQFLFSLASIGGLAVI